MLEPRKSREDHTVIYYNVLKYIMPKFKKFWKLIGPGLITGASDDDPSSIATYSIAGAKLGNAGLWTMLYTLPLMVAVQEMSARIGISSRCGLAGNLKRYYSKKLLFSIAILILASNIFNIGADVAGMAAAIDLLIPRFGSLTKVLIIGGILFTTVVLSYRKIVSIFKWLAFSLFAYVIAGFFSIDNWSGVLYHLVAPVLQFDKHFFILHFAILGTTISPYIAFWQASEEAEEKKLKAGKTNLVCEYRTVTRHELINASADTRIGMAFSNLIGFFIIALTSSVLFRAGVTNIESIADVAGTLKPLAGQYAYLLFTLGIVSSGLLAIPILAGSSAYVISEVFDWPASLDKPFSKARKFYLVIIASAAVGLAITYLGINPVKALFYTAILHGLSAPVLLAAIIHMANNPKIVGPNMNSFLSNIIGYVTMLLMTAGAIFFFITIRPNA